MKAKLVVFLLLITGLHLVQSSLASSKVVVINQPGTLHSLLSPADLDSVSDLTLKGLIDVRDFYLLRDSAKLLQRLDLSDAEVVEHRGMHAPFTDTLTFAAHEIPAAAFAGVVVQNYDSLLSEVVLPVSVTSIGSYAFMNCKQLTTIRIRSTVKHISTFAFTGTRARLEIDPDHPVFSIHNTMLMNKAQTTVMFCPISSTGTVQVPEGVDTIQPGAFHNCDSISSFVLPSTLRFAGNMAFAQCTGVRSIEVKTRPEVFGQYPGQFGGIDLKQIQLVVPYGMRPLFAGNQFWKNCAAITESAEGIVVNTGVLLLMNSKSINSLIVTSTAEWTAGSDQQWLRLNKIQGVAGKDTILIETDENLLPQDRTAQLTFTIAGVAPQRVFVTQMAAPRELDVEAGKLWQLIPTSQRPSTRGLVLKGLMDARDFKFLRDSLIAIELLDLTDVKISAYSGTEGTNTNGTTYAEDEIPAYGLFSGYVAARHNLKRILLPKKVKSIGDGAFVYCNQLDSVHFGDSLQNIGLSAFQGCSSLKHINLPATVQRIRSYAFMSCYGVRSLKVHTSVPVNIASDYFVFSDIDKYNCILWVPFGSVAAYAKATYWREFNKVNEFGTGIATGVSAVKLLSTGGRYVAVQVRSTSSWKATADQPWVKLITSRGAHGDSLRIAADDDLSFLQRTARVVVSLNDSSKSQYITVTQGSMPKTLTTTPGYLHNLLTTAERNTVTHLTLKGEIDNRDFVTLRDYMPQLAVLGLDSVKIVAFAGYMAPPNNADELPANAFFNKEGGAGKSSLHRIQLPLTLKSIGANAFQSCKSLTEIELPASVQTIGAAAFRACRSLQSVTTYAAKPINLDDSPGVFDYIDLETCTLNIPFFSGNKYREAAQWKEFGIINEMRGGLVAGTDTIALLKGLLTDSLVIYSNENWRISTDQTWLTFAVDSGFGNTTVQLQAEKNETTQLRKAIITATIEAGKSVQIVVVQEGKTKTIQAEAGQLASLLTPDELKFNSTLIVRGQMDARDFKTLRDAMPRLGKLDVSGVTIEAYIGTGGTAAATSVSYAENRLPRKALSGKVKLTELLLPETIIAIDDDAMSGCSGIREINFSTNLRFIGARAFENCKGLKELWLPMQLTTAGDYAFYACDSVNFLLIPSTMTTIGGYAFSARQLSTIIALPVNPVALYSAGVFSSVDKTKCQLYVPKGSKTNYLNYSQWNDFTTIREDILKFAGGDTLRIVSGEQVEKLIETDQTWTLVSDVDWITVSDSVGTGNSGIRLSGAVNNGFASRTGTVTATVLRTMKVKLVVIQSGKPLTINIQSGGLNAAVSMEDKDSLTHLIIKGTMDQRDFTVLRDQFPLLATLDMTGVNITAYTDAGGMLHKANEIPAYGFYVAWSGQGKKHLATVLFPASLTGIGKAAFGYTPQLHRVVMPETLTTLGEYAFMYCRGLKEVHFSSNLKEIPDYAFYVCDQLETVNLPERLTSIGYQSFFCCYALKQVSLPAGLKTMKQDAFYACRELESIEIPEGITILEEDVFGFCTSLTQITIPSTVTKIGSGALYSVPAKEIILPPNLTTLGSRALGKCAGITSVTLPRGLTSIGYGAFEHCTGLREIFAYNPNPVDLSPHYYATVFNNVSIYSCTLYVPSGSKSAYKLAVEWGLFRNIVEMTTEVAEVPAGALLLAPNPVADYLRVAGMQEASDIRIIDLQGRVWMQRQLQPMEELNVKQLPCGQYVVIVGGQVLKMRKL